MTVDQQKEITDISKKFAASFKNDIGDISGSVWLILDPLSAYLNSCGFDNKLYEIPSKNGMPQILIMEFKDGSKFIPAGSDLKLVHKDAKNWMWL